MTCKLHSIVTFCLLKGRPSQISLFKTPKETRMYAKKYFRKNAINRIFYRLSLSVNKPSKIGHHFRKNVLQFKHFEKFRRHFISYFVTTHQIEHSIIFLFHLKLKLKFVSKIFIGCLVKCISGELSELQKFCNTKLAHDRNGASS